MRGRMRCAWQDALCGVRNAPRRRRAYAAHALYSMRDVHAMHAHANASRGKRRGARRPPSRFRQGPGPSSLPSLRRTRAALVALPMRRAAGKPAPRERAPRAPAYSVRYAGRPAQCINKGRGSRGGGDGGGREGTSAPMTAASPVRMASSGLARTPISRCTAASRASCVRSALERPPPSLLRLPPRFAIAQRSEAAASGSKLQRSAAVEVPERRG